MLLPLIKLIRLKNLLIVIATQYLMRWCIINPILKLYNFQLQFSEFDFAMLVLATVLITAAGYVINDYFDTKTDSLNRPETVIVGKFISRRQVIILHTVLNTIGIILGIYVSYKINLLRLGIIYIIITGILWFYSTTYKRQFLIGNLIVAILTAMVPLIVALYEIPALNSAYKTIMIKNNANFNTIFLWVAGFSFFAFLTTLIREIIKDIEDFEGDNAFGRNTLPIVLGIKTTKTIVVSIIILTIAAIYLVYFNFLKDWISLFYIAILLTLPFLFLIFKLFKADKKEDYHFANQLSKLIMLFGIMYSLVVYYMFTYSFS